MMRLIIFFLSSLPLILSAQCEAEFIFDQSGATVQLVNVSSGNYVSELWDFGDGNMNDQSSKPTYTYTANGTYELCLSLYEAPNDSTTTVCDSVCQTIIISGLEEVSIMEKESFVRIYPNPVIEQLQINSEKPLTEVKLYTPLGNCLSLGDLRTIDFSTLSTGIYVLTYRVAGKLHHQKVLKR